MSYGELERLFEQFFALVEAAVRLPPGLERRIALRDVRDYGARIDQIATRMLKQGAEPRTGSSNGDVGAKPKVRHDNLPEMEHLGLPCIAVKRGGVHASSVLAYAGFRFLG